MSESLTIDFLYKTPVGRFILKGLVNPKVSKRAAKILSSRMSAAFVPSFIKKNNLKIRLNYGVFPSRPYDSKIIYGNPDKIKQIVKNAKNKELVKDLERMLG